MKGRKYFEKRTYVEGDAYLVEWLDASSRSGWQTSRVFREQTEDSNIRSVGWFIGANTDGIFLAGSRNNWEPLEDGYIGIQFIPHGCIYATKRLRLAPKEGQGGV